ncbi:MAG: TonB-dependent receptor [Bacteroidales bacterium]
MIKESVLHKAIKIGILSIMVLFSLQASAQIVVTGNAVAGTDNSPLPGVNIAIKGTSLGTVTDPEGKFTISVPSRDAVLVFSMVGMLTEEVIVGNQTNISIIMIEDLVGLDEVVVVGYGTMRKADVTGSVGSIDSKNLVKKGTLSLLESMQGAVAGVSITQIGGRSQSSGYDIQIRGKSSINLNVTPLYVVDGVIVNDIDFLNPQEIERIDILKDASSTAIFGSRATAGVVMITTKSGKSVAGRGVTKPELTYDAYYGLTKIARMPDFMDAQEFYNYRFLNFLSTNNATGQPVYRMAPESFQQGMLYDGSGTYVMKEMLKSGESYNWPGMITQDGEEQNHYLTVSGSSESVNYYFGTGYNTNIGTYKGDAQDRFSFKGSMDSKINDYFSAGLNFNMTYTKSDFASDDAIKEAFRMNPFMRPYDEDGNYNVKPGNFQAMGTASNQFSDQENPLLYNEDEQKEAKNYRVLGNVYLEVRPIKNLTLKSTFSPNYIHTRTGQYQGGATGNTPTGSYSSLESFDWTWDNTINYNLTVSDHSLGVMGLYSMNSYNSERYAMTAINPTEGTTWYDLSSGEMQAYSSEYSENSMISYAMRLNYGYKGKYLITATARADGSSRFGTTAATRKSKWGTFPSAAIAWRISEEEFMKTDWLSNLKIRLSYGITGNNSGIDNYATHTTGEGPNYYAFGNKLAPGYFPSGPVNLALTWETSSETNLGFDFGIFEGRISGTLDVYKKDSKNLLVDRLLPLVSGGGHLFDNVGNVQNRGIEVSVNSINISTEDLKWETSFAFSANKNEVTQIYGTNESITIGDNPITGSVFLNEPVKNIYEYVWDGIVTDRMMTVPDNQASAKGGFTAGSQVTEADYYYAIYGWTEGMPKIADLNHDGSIDADNDKKVQGSQDPQWTGNISSTLTYKGWDFSFSIYTKQNYLVYSNFLYEYYNYAYRGWNKLNMDYYIPAGTLVDCDGVTADGLYVNPVYQEQTHYGDFPFFNATTANYGAGSIWYEKEKRNLAGIVDASYWKVRNISLGYSFNKSLLSKFGFETLRVYTNITNPFVFTKYKGFDPEWAGADSKYDGPGTTTFQFGVNLKF